MSLGPVSAPSTFKKIIEELVRALLFVCIYLDNEVVFSCSLADHVEHIQRVLGIVAERPLKIKPRKCKFGKEKEELLGPIVDKDGFCTDPERVKVTRATSRPPAKGELQSFLCLEE